MNRRPSLYLPLFTQGKTHLPQNLLTNAGTVIEGFESTTGWGTTGTLENNATQVKQGTQSLKLTSQVGGTGVTTKTISLDLSSLSSCIRIAIYLHGNPTTKTVNLRISSSTTLAKYFNYVCVLTRPNAWHEFSIFPADWTNTGGESWDNTMIRLRLAMPAAGAEEQTQMSFDNLRGGVVQLPAAQLCWSDARDNIYTLGFPIANRRKFRMSWYVPTAAVGGANKVTWAQLQALAAKGHVIGHHSQSHVDISQLADQGAMQAEIAAAVADLTANGLSTYASYMLNPGGLYNETFRLALEAEGVTLNHNGEITGAQKLPLPVADLLTMRFFFINDTVTLQDVKDQVDAAITRMEVIPLLFDGLVDGPASGVEWSLSDFEALVDYIIEDVEIPILSDKNLVDLASGPITIPRAK